MEGMNHIDETKCHSWEKNISIGPLPLSIATKCWMNESSTPIIYTGKLPKTLACHNYSPPIIRPDWPPISVQSIITSTSNVGFLVFPPLRVNPFTHMTSFGSLNPRMPSGPQGPESSPYLRSISMLYALDLCWEIRNPQLSLTPTL